MCAVVACMCMCVHVGAHPCFTYVFMEFKFLVYMKFPETLVLTIFKGAYYQGDI